MSTEMAEVPDISDIKPDYTKKVVKGTEADSILRTVILSLFESSEARGKVITFPGMIRYVDCALSEKTCCLLRELIDASPMLSFWKGGIEKDQKALDFRNADTLEMNSMTFGNSLHKSLNSYYSDIEIYISEEDNFELAGTWHPITTNSDILFAKYPPGGHFAPHTDGNSILDFNTRSMFSIIIFLNSIPLEKGGGTRFYQEDAVHHLERDTKGRWTCNKETYCTREIEAVQGRMLLFHQSQVHEGIPCLDGYEKYILRSDVMFQRKLAICDSENDRQAYALYREGELLAETHGAVDESIKKMRKALKMSKNLAYRLRM
jgi:hypothetical protein